MKTLTQNQRIEARQRAVRAVEKLAGEKPRRENFKHSVLSKYPAWINAVVVFLSLLVLLCAFLLSAMRLYSIGRETFYATLPNESAAIIAGIAIVLLSEAAAVLFTIALSVIGHSAIQRRILAASIAATAALALSGNYYVALADHHLTAFTVLEAMLPPLLTLSTAYVLKELLLKTIEQRHADNLAYEDAVRTWKAASADPESHPRFMQAYANELRDSLVKANRRDESIYSLSDSQWNQLVANEIRADNWYSEQPPAPEVDTQPYSVVQLEDTRDFLPEPARNGH